MRYERIEQHREAFPIRWMCSALEVSERGFQSWRGRPESERGRTDRRLLVAVRASYERSDRTYGSPRILKDLRETGCRCSVKRIARPMRANGLVAVQRRPFRITTESGHNLPVQTNLLQRDFATEGINRVWLADITYVGTEEGW